MNKKTLKNKAVLMALTGRKVCAARKEMDWTQEELAVFSGISTVYVSRVEVGKCNVSLFILYQLAQTLGVEIAALLPTKKELDEVEEATQ